MHALYVGTCQQLLLCFVKDPQRLHAYYLSVSEVCPYDEGHNHMTIPLTEIAY